METIALLYSTGVPHVDRILQGAIGMLELLFPGRIGGYYLVGSYADGSFTAASDLDLVPMFQGELRQGEEATFWSAVHALNQLSPIRLGFGLRNEAESFSRGGVGIKIGSELVYGEDVRDRIPLTPLDQYQRQSIETSLQGLALFRGNPARLTFPLDYPNPDDRFFDYVRETGTEKDHQRGTADLFTYLMFYASTMVTLKHGLYNASKGYSWQFYQAHIQDGWGDFLQTVYETCKKRWNYQVPVSNEDQGYLQDLCRQTLAFENHFLAVVIDYLKEQLKHQNKPDALWASRLLQKIQFGEPE